MASPRSAGENGAQDGADAVGDAFLLVAQGLVQEMAQLQKALNLQKQEAERKVQEAEWRMQEALHLHKQEAERTMQEALRQQKQEAERKVQEAEWRMQEALRQQKQDAESKVQEAEWRMREALRVQEERASAALREVERKLQEKDAAIRALLQPLQETQVSVNALEERRSTSEGPAGEGDTGRLQRRVNEVEASLQSALQKFMPRVEALLLQLEEPQSARASLATAASTSVASACKAPATGWAPVGGGREALSSSSSSSFSTPSGAGHQGAAADEEQRERRRVVLRVREVQLKIEEARTSPSPLGEQLCKAAKEGRLSDVRRLIDSGADVNYTNRYGSIPLVNAAFNAHVDVMSLLLQRGADVNAVDELGFSALHLAAWSDRSGRCVELLVRSGVDVNARDIDGETPLHTAACNNNEEAVRALLAAGARRDLKAWGGWWDIKTPSDVAASSIVRNLFRL